MSGKVIQSRRKSTRKSGDRLGDSNDGAVGARATDHLTVDHTALALHSAPIINITSLRGVAQQRNRSESFNKFSNYDGYGGSHCDQQLDYDFNMGK